MTEWKRVDASNSRRVMTRDRTHVLVGVEEASGKWYLFLHDLERGFRMSSGWPYDTEEKARVGAEEAGRSWLERSE